MEGLVHTVCIVVLLVCVWGVWGVWGVWKVCVCVCVCGCGCRVGLHVSVRLTLPSNKKETDDPSCFTCEGTSSPCPDTICNGVVCEHAQRCSIYSKHAAMQSLQKTKGSTECATNSMCANTQVILCLSPNRVTTPTSCYYTQKYIIEYASSAPYLLQLSTHYL